VVHVTSGSSTSTLHTYAAEDFPRLPDLDAVGTFTVERQSLLDTVSRVSRSASRDESRPVLTGILVRFEAGKLVMAATDSYRLSVKETALSGEVPELEAIIPARALGELARIAQSGDNIELGVHENQVVFAADDVWLTTRRIDGQFPNYKQLLPEAFEHDVTLPRNEVLDVVRRVGVMVQRTSPIQLRFAEGELTVFVLRRAARDRVQRGVPARRHRVDRRGRDPATSDLTASPRRHRGRRGRPDVPDHADPAARVERSLSDRRQSLASEHSLVRPT
jgi:DNA polymerase-3 subunit beta